MIDIDKAMNYLQYVNQDINKAIHYFTLASKQNLPDFQYYLAIIYINFNIIY